MATRMQQAGAIFRNYLNEQPLDEPFEPQQSKLTPTVTHQPQLLQTHQIKNHPLYSNPTLIYPNLKPPQYTSQHIYDAKKSGTVNEIINSINNQHQNVLEAINISQKNVSTINSHCKQLFNKCQKMNHLEERLKTHYCDLEKNLNKKLSLIDELERKVYHIESYQKIIQDQQHKIEDLVIFIYKYLNGKRKKNYLKNSLLKILGHNNRDLRKYNLEEPIQLNQLFISTNSINTKSYTSRETADKNDCIKTHITGGNINKLNKNKYELKELPTNDNNLIKNNLELKDICINPHESNDIKDQIDSNSLELNPNDDNINNTIKNDIELKLKDVKIIENQMNKKTEKIIISNKLIKNLNGNNSLNNIPKTKEMNTQKSPKIIKPKPKESNAEKSPKNKNNNHKDKKQQKNQHKRTNNQKKKFTVKNMKNKKKNNNKNSKTKLKIKKTKHTNNNNLKYNNIKDKPPENNNKKNILNNKKKTSNPWDLHASDPFWKLQLELFNYSKDYEHQKKYINPKMSIKEFFEAFDPTDIDFYI